MYVEIITRHKNSKNCENDSGGPAYFQNILGTEGVLRMRMHAVQHLVKIYALHCSVRHKPPIESVHFSLRNSNATILKNLPSFKLKRLPVVKKSNGNALKNMQELLSMLILQRTLTFGNSMSIFNTHLCMKSTLWNAKIRRSDARLCFNWLPSHARSRSQ